MESTIDLILKGHFEQLKGEVNKHPIQQERIAELNKVMKDVVDYLKTCNETEGQALKERLIEALAVIRPIHGNELFGLAKKPMRKAGKKSQSAGKRKAM